MLIEAMRYSEKDLAKSDYLLAPHVIFLRAQDGSARLLNLGGKFYTVSWMGAQLLDATLREGSAGAAVRIATAYRAALSEVQRDLSAFLRDLEKKHLIRSTGRRLHLPRGKVSRPLLLLPLRAVSVSPLSLEKKAWMLLALASVMIRLFGWPEVVVNWHSFLQNYAPRCAGEKLEQSAQEIGYAVRKVAAGHPFSVECKERALSCWWLLSSSGYAANLIVGISLFPLECHCWCEAGQRVVSDDPDRCEQFIPILSYKD